MNELDQAQFDIVVSRCAKAEADAAFAWDLHRQRRALDHVCSGIARGKEAALQEQIDAHIAQWTKL